MLIFNPSNWYWAVGSSTTQVWSSARVQYVPVTDSTYVAWSANSSNATTRIRNTSEILEVLNTHWLPSIMATGFPAISSSNPTLNDTYSFSPNAVQYISGISTGIAAGKGLPGGGSTFIYAGHTFTSSEFLNFASVMENFVYNYNLALATIANTGSGSLPSLPLVID